MTDQDALRSLDDFSTDHANTHRSTAGQHEQVDPTLTAQDKATILEKGYVVWERLFDEDAMAAIRREAAPHLTHFGRNDLEGVATKRVYAVLGKTDCCTPLAEHPRALSLLDELLLQNYLLSMFQIIEIHPGEKQQILHHDDVFYPLPRPRPPVSVATILAVDDFTAENGATVVLPGSHRWDGRRPTADDEVIPVVMPAGSVVVTLGTLWHGGGANRSQHPRLAVTAQYCEPWARTQENYYLGVPRAKARALSPSMQRMLGYSVHAPFMGNVDGKSPLRCLNS